jgi:hypothetical protein
MRNGSEILIENSGHLQREQKKMLYWIYRTEELVVVVRVGIELKWKCW